MKISFLSFITPILCAATGLFMSGMVVYTTQEMCIDALAKGRAMWEDEMIFSAQVSKSGNSFSMDCLRVTYVSGIPHIEQINWKGRVEGTCPEDTVAVLIGTSSGECRLR